MFALCCAVHQHPQAALSEQIHQTAGVRVPALIKEFTYDRMIVHDVVYKKKTEPQTQKEVVVPD